MPKEIYNLGRVVGYSTYELYVKHALEENPDIEPATEKEWLANQLGLGISMLLKVPKDAKTEPHVVDFKLPDDSALCAGNTIIASIFFGECEVDENGWATKVTDYGQGISNTKTTHPSDGDTININTYPTQTIEEFDESHKKELLQYLKIQDGVVLQPGTWVTTDHNNPPYDFNPDLHEEPTLRLTFLSQVTEPFYILFTSFSHRSVLNGISTTEFGSTNEVRPENGDFLGPEIYPWANKITFMCPPVAPYLIRKYTVIADKPNESESDKKIPSENLRIDYDEDSIYTILNASYLKPDLGISIDGPRTEAGDIIIGGKISKEPNNYILVEQKSSTTAGEEVTKLTHSPVEVGKGISYHSPTTPAEPIKISSIIESTNTFLKVEQKNESNSSKDAGETTTFLTSSEIEGGDGIQVIEPSNPGDTVHLSVVIKSSNENYLTVSQSNGVTTLTPAVIANTDGLLNITTTVVSGKPQININIDWEALVNKIKIDTTVRNGLLGDIWGAIKQILSKIGAGTASLSTSHKSGHSAPSNADDLVSIDWSTDPVVSYRSDGKIPLGNMNIYSSNNRFIKSSNADHNGDLKVN